MMSYVSCIERTVYILLKIVYHVTVILFRKDTAATIIWIPTVCWSKHIHV